VLTIFLFHGVILRPPNYFVKSAKAADYMGGRLIADLVRLGHEMKNPCGC
jgi:hypothetical protein